MQIKVLFFASVREALNCAELRLEWPQGDATTVAAVRAVLLARGEQWTVLKNMRVRAALNHAVVAEDAMVRAGDELAFFPPVTGG